MEPRWGKCLGRYELVAELGRGAMGVVYKARDPKIDRFVAVKTVSLLGANEDEAQEYRNRFFHEAQAAGRLVHPGIVTIFDVGEEPDSRTPFIVMEHVDGRSLAQLLSENGNKLPLDRALELTEELAEALDCAHGQGIVHRDLKPANILVTSAGRAKITDFGIAKLNLTNLTLRGQILGTPAYMSPEQLNGDEVDGRADLFSLGVILYSMVAGYRPFQGNSVTTVCFKLANHDPVPPSALDHDLPEGVDVIVARAMAKDPEERYQRGLEFALDVRELRDRLSAGSGGISADGRLLALKTRGSTSPPAGLITFGWLYRQMTRAADRADLWRLKAIHSVRRHLRRLAEHPAAPIAACTIAIAGLVWLALHQWSFPLPVRSFDPDRARPSAIATPVRVEPPALKPPPPEKKPSVRPPTLEFRASSPAPSTAPPPSVSATLIIGITYPFSDASLSVSADNSIVYSSALKAETKKRL